MKPYKTMVSYCSKCRKIKKTGNGKMMLLSKCVLNDCKKSRFIKEEEASELLNKLGVKSHLRKITMLGDI